MMRRLAVISAFFAVVIAAVVLSTPWWLGAALARVGPSFGVTFESYDRVGYSRFILHGAEYRHERVTVSVQQVEADTPLVWLWQRWTGSPGTVVAGEWITEVSAAKSKQLNKSEWGWVRLQVLLKRISDSLAAWMPRVEAGKGVVKWPGTELTFTSATWKDRTVTCPDLGWRSLHASVAAEFPEEEPIEAKATLLDGSANAVVRSSETTLTGDVRWRDQPAVLTAEFDGRGWLPREAMLRAENWEISGDQAKVGAHYAFIRGGGRVEWRDRRLSTELMVQGEPFANTPVPPMKVNLRGHGTNEAFVVESLDVNLPGVMAHLSAPVAIDAQGRLRSEPSTFTAEANMAELPWFRARGTLRGDGRITANADGIVKINFNAGGENIEVAGTALSRISAVGDLEWPVLTIENGTLAAVDGSELTARGGWSFRDRELMAVSLQGRIQRSLLDRWLPEYPMFNTIDIDAKGAGPWTSAKHQGQLRVADLRLKHMQPLALQLDWEGRGGIIDLFTGDIRGGDTKMLAKGSLSPTTLTLKEFTFANGEATRLSLTRPAEFRWKPEWRLSEVELVGSDASIRAAVELGKAGSIQLRAEKVRSEWFRSILILPSTDGVVTLLEARAEWDDGPAIFAINAGLDVDLGKNRSAQFSTELKGSAEGMEIAALRVAEAGAVIVNASGRLPIVVHPAGDEKWRVDADGPIALQAATSSNPSFWETITQLTGVAIEQPEATVHFDGTLNKPRGEVRLSAVRIAPVAERFKGNWPRIEALDVHLVGDKEGVTLEKFAVAIEGQAVRLSGKLPVAADYWSELKRNPRKLIERGQVRIEVPDAQISAFVHYFPEYIAPQGRFHLDLAFDGEKSVTGSIRVDDAISRPLGPLGVLQEINADIRFAGRTATFQAVTARMGGQLVTLQGRAEVPAGRRPELNLTLVGENLPFVRRAGLLVRGDLDLKLVTPENAPPMVQGDVKLRDSLFLADIRSLLPSGTKGGESRPPYFALKTPPLNVWGLDVTVQGDKFFRLRTPVFNGTASARFRLTGTLGEPRIAGEATVDEGNIRLPFANFTVRQGEVRLSADQAEPQIWLAATTRRYGYDLRMELTGSTSSPNLAFTSSPPLEAEQVLLMVMAGEAPRNEISTTDRQRMARFGAFFGQSLLGSLGGDSTGADRLTISSGGDISEQGRETYSIEYRLDDRWAVTGEYDEFDDYYGGLKWRIYPKGEKQDETD